MILPILLLLAQLDGEPRPPPVPEVKLKVGEQLRSPVRKATLMSCLDANVAKGVLVDGRIEIRGVRKGTTRCTLTEPTKKPSAVQITVGD